LPDELSEDTPIDTLRAKVVELLATRLGATDGGEVEAASEIDAEVEEENDEESSSDIEEEVSASENDDLDVGHSKLKQFFEFISDDDAVRAWLNAGAGDKEHRDEDLRDLLRSLLKPAMIVDGQHRVSGAYEAENASEISFTVNAIKDADWVEQVFQFVVLNKMAKSISPSFLTSILNTSLTNAEVGDIEHRLENIGIKNTDRIIVKYLNHDERSPFFEMVAEPGEMLGVNREGKLSDKGMIRIAKRWHALRNSDKRKQLQMFVPALGAGNITEARVKWQSYETWFPFFYAFWDEIRKKYEPADLWEKKSKFHLLYIVTMMSMQDMFLEDKAKGDSSFSSLSDFRAQVGRFFSDVPPTFFQDWQATGLQSGEGPKWIKEALEMFRSGQRLSTVRDKSPLFQIPKG